MIKCVSKPIINLNLSIVLYSKSYLLIIHFNIKNKSQLCLLLSYYCVNYKIIIIFEKRPMLYLIFNMKKKIVEHFNNTLKFYFYNIRI